MTTPVHVSPTFTTYRSQDPSSPESVRSPVHLEGLLSEEDYPIPTVREEEMAEGLVAAMSAGMSLQDLFGSSNPTWSELEEWYRQQFSKEVVAPPVAPRPRPTREEKTGTSPKELSLNKPDGFTGEHDKFTAWLLSVRTYLMMNAHVYDTNEKQIGFTLSYMTRGSALAFKENYIEGCISDGLNLFIAESFAEFVKKLKNVYEVGDIKVTSMLHLANIKQGNRSLAEYASQFLMLMKRAGIQDGTPMGTFFGKGLATFLSDRILSLRINPDSVQDWIKITSSVNAAEATKCIFKGTDTAEDCKNLYYQEHKATTPRKFHDPDTMDIDRGKPKMARPLECFGCKGPHMRRDCPKEKGKFDKQRCINELHLQLSQLEDMLDVLDIKSRTGSICPVPSRQQPSRIGPPRQTSRNSIPLSDSVISIECSLLTSHR